MPEELKFMLADWVRPPGAAAADAWSGLFLSVAALLPTETACCAAAGSGGGGL